MSMTRPPTIKKTSEGRTIAVIDDVHRILASDANTHGTHSILPAIVHLDVGPPLLVYSGKQHSIKLRYQW